MDQRQDEVADEGDSAAAAFETLRAEVAALRGSIDAFPAAVQDSERGLANKNKLRTVLIGARMPRL